MIRSASNVFHSTRGNVQERVLMRDVPKTFDSGDIDNHGRWIGEEMCCLECRETVEIRAGITSTYLLAVLHCSECGEPFAEYWI